MKKKILSTFIVLSIVTFQFLCFGELFFRGYSDVYAWSQTAIGDVNADGVINSSDYSLMKRYILRFITDFPADDDMWVGDVNGDNVINSTDYNYLKRYLLRMINEFPKNSNTPAPTFTPTPTPTPTLHQRLHQRRLALLLQALKRAITVTDIFLPELQNRN
ncbi:dockerin type I repeat-containing protein [Acetivibrio straminisolvens]|uniref:Endoglucanase n=1 Tax=Acetivibrio straminisolvens JCM 21531 TaxID=1294263 RepID=W4VAU6_9FIRM|nr:dockerin type I repeat-containing protein [Acetivibrio straminisolvens]GAE89908.1 endoglucanase [Acetivibrio straminisolvens JCM 21531]